MTDITQKVFSVRDPADVSPVVMSFVPELNVTVPPVGQTETEYLVSAQVSAKNLSAFQPNDLITNGSLIVEADVFDANGHKVGTSPNSAVLTILTGGTANRRYEVTFTVQTNWGATYNRSGIQEVRNL